jgi:hypothetical protein
MLTEKNLMYAFHLFFLHASPLTTTPLTRGGQVGVLSLHVGGGETCVWPHSAFFQAALKVKKRVGTKKNNEVSQVPSDNFVYL